MFFSFACLITAADYYHYVRRSIYPHGGYLKMSGDHYAKLSNLDVSPRYKAKKLKHLQQKEKKVRYARDTSYSNNISYCCYNRCDEDFFCWARIETKHSETQMCRDTEIAQRERMINIQNTIWISQFSQVTKLVRIPLIQQSKKNKNNKHPSIIYIVIKWYDYLVFLAS